MIFRPFLSFCAFYVPLLLIDLFSCYLTIRRVNKGKGASGDPIVTWMLYSLMLLAIPVISPKGRTFVVILSAIVAILITAVVHIIIVFMIPRQFAAMRRNAKGS